MQEQDLQERHHRMYEKTRLEKLNVANRHNYLADQTFQSGQNILNDVKDKINVAEGRKNTNLSEVKSRQTQHIEKVVQKMEQSWLTEEERKEQAMYRNEDKKLNFLQRLEDQNQMKDQDLKSKFDKVRETNSRVRERQAIDKKRRDRQRFTLEKKSEKQNDQVRLAHDKSMQSI